MRQFLLKTVIVVVAVYILFQFTLGYRIDGVITNIKSISNQHQRIEFKNKILSEMKKGVEKNNIFSEEERLILSNFINKILFELDLKRTNK